MDYRPGSRWCLELQTLKLRILRPPRGESWTLSCSSCANIRAESKGGRLSPCNLSCTHWVGVTKNPQPERPRANNPWATLSFARRTLHVAESLNEINITANPINGTEPGTETDNPHPENGNDNDNLYVYDKPNSDNGYFYDSYTEFGHLGH